MLCEALAQLNDCRVRPSQTIRVPDSERVDEMIEMLKKRWRIFDRDMHLHRIGEAATHAVRPLSALLIGRRAHGRATQ